MFARRANPELSKRPKSLMFGPWSWPLFAVSCTPACSTTPSVHMPFCSHKPVQASPQPSHSCRSVASLQLFLHHSRSTGAHTDNAEMSRAPKARSNTRIIFGSKAQYEAYAKNQLGGSLRLSLCGLFGP